MITTTQTSQPPQGLVASQVFEALADPTRRTIFERLCAEPRPVGVLAQDLPVSRPAVSQHLKTLERTRLVTQTRDGTRRIYSPSTEGLVALRAWVERYWDAVLGQFAQAAEAAQAAELAAQRDPSQEGETR